MTARDLVRHVIIPALEVDKDGLVPVLRLRDGSGPIQGP